MIAFRFHASDRSKALGVQKLETRHIDAYVAVFPSRPFGFRLENASELYYGGEISGRG